MLWIVSDLLCINGIYRNVCCCGVSILLVLIFIVFCVRIKVMLFVLNVFLLLWWIFCENWLRRIILVRWLVVVVC